MKYKLILFVVLALCLTQTHMVLSQPYDSDTYDIIRSYESKNYRGWSSLDQDSAHSYDQLSLSLDYRVESDVVPMTGTATLTLRGLEQIPAIQMNAEGMTILSVTHNNQSVSYTHSNDTLDILYPLNTGETVTLAIQVSVPPDTISYGNLGYHVGVDHVFTFSEPFGARKWYPCFDQPFDKFNETTVAVNMPEAWSLASNGLLVETTYPAAGRKREVYHNTYPISTYLVMLCAGNYSKEIHTENDIQFRYFALPTDSAMVSYDWARTPQATAFLAGRIGAYPFSAYGMVQAVIMGGWGAMEHQTMTTFGNHLVDSTRFFEGIVVHELAHQWFGDALTPVDFRNMWLSEGFATYCDLLWSEEQQGVEYFRNVRLQEAYNFYFSEDRQMRYAIYDPPAPYLFGAAIYYKGAVVLNMLRDQIMGDSLFFEAMTAYANSYRYGSVSTEDFIGVMNTHVGYDLHWFFNQWIYSPGFPILDIFVTPGTPTANDVTVTVLQQQTNAHVFRIPVYVDVRTVEGVTRQPFWFDQVSQSVVQNYSFPIQSAVLSAYQPLLYQGTGASLPEPGVRLPQLISLGMAYPNPFNPSTVIPLELKAVADVQLDVFDINGRLVQSLASGLFQPGHHDFVFSPGQEHGSGLYLIRLRSGALQQVTKAILIK